MLVGFHPYVCMRYIGQNQQAATTIVSSMAMITIVISLLSGPASDRLSRRKFPVFVAAIIIAVGIIIPWVWPARTAMLIYAALMGLGYGSYTAVDQALNIDVLPNPDEADKDLDILNLANTLSQVIAAIVVSPIVAVTSAYFLVFPIAAAAVMAGTLIILTIKKVK